MWTFVRRNRRVVIPGWNRERGMKRSGNDPASQTSVSWDWLHPLCDPAEGQRFAENVRVYLLSHNLTAVLFLLQVFCLNPSVLPFPHLSYCWFILSTWDLLPVCLSWGAEPPLSSQLTERSGSFPLRVEALRMEDVSCCAGCEAAWGRFINYDLRLQMNVTWLLEAAVNLHSHVITAGTRSGTCLLRSERL